MVNREEYKKQIEKVAYIYADNKGNLHLEGNNYDKIVDIKKDKNWNREQWNMARNDIDNYLNSSPLKKKFLEEEKFNKDRNKVKNKHSDFIGNFVTGAVPMVAGITSGVRKKSISSGAKSMITSLAPAYATGKLTKYMLDEAERNKKMGKIRRETTKALEDDVLRKFKGKRYGYEDEDNNKTKKTT